MDNKLTYVLMPLERSMVFQILEQKARFKNATGKRKYKCKNGIKILEDSSDSGANLQHPSLSLNVRLVSLRGSQEEQDYEPSVYLCKDNDERDKLIDEIHEALNEWAKYWNGEECVSECESIGDYIYKV